MVHDKIDYYIGMTAWLYTSGATMTPLLTYIAIIEWPIYINTYQYNYPIINGL